MSDPLLLGIDAGQTVTKAALFDLSGQQRGMGSARVPSSSPRPRWVERDMAAVWEATATAIRAALVGVDPSDVAAIGLAGHNDGAYLVDRAGDPVRPGITAVDSRAYSIVDGWQADGVARKALPLTGQSPFAGSPAALYRWLAENEPAHWERTRWVLFCKDWLRLRLTGEVATDPTEASASFTDVHTQAYSDQAIGLYAVPGISDRLPPLLASAAPAGAVTEAAAAATGLRAGTPVVTGAHDVDAAALGMGAVGAGDVSIVMGTFSINQVISDQVRLDHRWQARAFLRPGQWLNMSTSPASSTNLDWFVRTLGSGMSYDEVGQEAVAALAAGDDADPLIFLPFLYGSPLDLGARAAGGFHGMRGWHTRGHLLLALMEGIVFNHRWHLDALRSAFPLAPTARLCGGGAKSQLWSQLLADATGLRLEVTDTDEPGARGAAMLAGIGAGLYESLAAAANQAVRVVSDAVPTAAGTDRMARRWDAYTQLISTLQPLWKPS
ncbi:FGGY-family carbohydrate kinase [Fodinicola feengrottensis]|uniref:FGGY-family carbohydrate kinase n=1 Tax=Fodinicola feengrottensis TaxID=435914 RepID=A0ABP4VH82_9ACTN